jgi:tripartite-type tricarboxylate transporter receptor subunit TctC
MRQCLSVPRRRALRSMVGLTASCMAPSMCAYAQPSVLTIVVPFNAGSGPDAMARFFGEQIQIHADRPVVVENKAGASGNIGTQFVALAKPDGNTLLLTANTLVMNASLFKGLRYDPVSSFTPLGRIATGRLALVVSPRLPIENAVEFAAYAKSHASEFVYSSPGPGTPQHLAMELLLKQQGLSVTHVPYSGSAQATNDLMAGHVGAMFLGLHLALPLARAKRLRIIGIGSPTRSPAAPEISTLGEQGVPSMDADAWYGLFCSSGTAEATVDRLRATTRRVLDSTAMRDFLTQQGLEPSQQGLPEFEAVIRSDRQRWAEVIRDNHIVVN